MKEAAKVIEVLPPGEVGTCVLAPGGEALFGGTAEDLRRALAEGGVAFHAGSIRGAFPRALRRADSHCGEPGRADSIGLG